MKNLQNIYESIKKNGFFGSLLANKNGQEKKEHVSPFASRIPVVYEFDLKQQEIVEDCEKFKIDNIDDHIYGRDIKNVTLTALEHLFKGVADLGDPGVHRYLLSLRKGLAESTETNLEFNSFVHTGLYKDNNENPSELNKLVDFFHQTNLTNEIDGQKKWVAFKLYTTDFRLVRLNQLKEVQYQKVNSQASDKLTGAKIEDILCGHYKMKKIPTIYKEIIEENKIGWKILTDDEKSRFGKHLNMMVAEGVVERYGNAIRFQEQKALNVWLSSPDARNYQSIKPDLIELEKNFKNDLKKMLYSENEDDRRSARKLQRREIKERFRISSKP